MAADDDPLFLQVRASASVLEPMGETRQPRPTRGRRPAPDAIGERHVPGMDDKGHGRHFYIRQLRDMSVGRRSTHGHRACDSTGRSAGGAGAAHGARATRDDRGLLGSSRPSAGDLRLRSRLYPSGRARHNAYVKAVRQGRVTVAVDRRSTSLRFRVGRRGSHEEFTGGCTGSWLPRVARALRRADRGRVFGRSPARRRDPRQGARMSRRAADASARLAAALISPDWQVMTAAHVVHSMDQIRWSSWGPRRSRPRWSPSEPRPSRRPARRASGSRRRLANSNTLRWGIGHHRGRPTDSATAERGPISARWAPKPYKTMPPPSFTSATINTGNSGGPMFAMNEVVGIVSHNIPERRQRGPASS